MQDIARTVIVLMLFVVLALYLIPAVIYNPLFLAQAKRHSKISSNHETSNGNFSPLVQLTNVTIGRGGSSLVTNSIHTDTGHNGNILRNALKLLKQEKHFAQTKLRQVLGEIIPHQYIVVLKNGTENPQILVQQAVDRGAIVPFVYYHAIKGFTMKIPNRLALNSVLKDPSVDFVEPDIKVHAFSVSSTGYSRVGGSNNIDDPHLQIGINAGIAIIDTGIDLSHPALNVYKQVSFVPGTSKGNDDNGHGTAVAGIAAAKDGSFGVIGIAPGARLWAVKVLDSTGTGSISTIIEGIDYVTQNAKQIDAANLSFGCQCTSSALDVAINSSIAAGVSYVVAAGNSGEDASSWSPANNPNVISVAAIADSDGKCGGLGPPTPYGPDDSLASFSNFGSKVTIAAPGVNIYTTFMGSSYATLSGTSIATPFVTGAAALYHSLHPTASPAQVHNALVSMGSTASTICNGDGHGYFSNPHDNEPLLYVGNITGG